jgi:large subunit ribosomal protein L25
MALQLNAKIRTEKGNKNKDLRKSGGLPAVLYGHNVPSTPITLDAKEFAKIYKAAGETSIVNVTIDEGAKKEARPVLIYYVDRDPMSNQPIHADLYQVRMDEKISTSVPLVFVGESSAVKNLKGTLVKNIYEVEIEALPGNLPKELAVDLSKLETFSDTITLKDIKAPTGVELTGNLDDIIALVTEQRSEDELKSLEAEVKVDVSAIKTEGEEKREKKQAEAETEKKAA